MSKRPAPVDLVSNNNKEDDKKMKVDEKKEEVPIVLKPGNDYGRDYIITYRNATFHVHSTIIFNQSQYLLNHYQKAIVKPELVHITLNDYSVTVFSNFILMFYSFNRILCDPNTQLTQLCNYTELCYKFGCDRMFKNCIAKIKDFFSDNINTYKVYELVDYKTDTDEWCPSRIIKVDNTRKEYKLQIFRWKNSEVTIAYSHAITHLSPYKSNSVNYPDASKLTLDDITPPIIALSQPSITYKLGLVKQCLVLSDRVGEFDILSRPIDYIKKSQPFESSALISILNGLSPRIITCVLYGSLVTQTPTEDSTQVYTNIKNSPFFLQYCKIASLNHCTHSLNSSEITITKPNNPTTTTTTIPLPSSPPLPPPPYTNTTDVI